MSWYNDGVHRKRMGVHRGMKDKQKIIAIENREEQTPSGLEKTKRQQKQIIFRRRRLTIMFTVAFALFTFMGVSLFRNGQHLLKLQDTKQEVKQEFEAAKVQKKDLTDEVTLLNDKEYVEKIARAKYFYSKEDEQVYSVPELNGTKKN